MRPLIKIMNTTKQERKQACEMLAVICGGRIGKGLLPRPIVIHNCSHNYEFRFGFNKRVNYNYKLNLVDMVKIKEKIIRSSDDEFANSKDCQELILNTSKVIRYMVEFITNMNKVI